MGKPGWSHVQNPAGVMSSHPALTLVYEEGLTFIICKYHNQIWLTKTSCPKVSAGGEPRELKHSKYLEEKKSNEIP